jgi:hypothetical protein
VLEVLGEPERADELRYGDSGGPLDEYTRGLINGALRMADMARREAMLDILRNGGSVGTCCARQRRSRRT